MKKSVLYLLAMFLFLNISCSSDSDDNGSEPAPITSIKSNTTSLDFGDQILNTSKKLSFTITNNGNQDINEITVGSSTTQFTINIASFSLNAGASKNIEITFTPTELKKHTGNIEVKLKPDTFIILDLSGTGTQLQPITSIKSNTTSLDFGDQILNTSKKLSFTITNDGNQDINEITVGSSTTQFTINTTSFSLNAGASKNIEVSFTPTESKEYTGNLEVKLKPDTFVIINLNGMGVKVNYNSHIKPIMSQSCSTIGCHSGSNPRAGISLTNYNDVKKSFDGSEIYNSLLEIKSGRMPRNASKLNDDTIALIEKWKAEGFLE